MAHTHHDKRFDGKIALVTGGTAGIGLAIAMELLHEGGTVVTTSLPADVESGHRAFEDAGFDPLIVGGDMSDESFCKQSVQQTIGRHGRIDCLVNNAFSFLAKWTDATRDDWHESLDAGPVAFATMISLVADLMKQGGGGSIVNIASISSWIAQPKRWTYNAAKGAVAQITRCAALDLAPYNIRVNGVSPGWIWTRVTDEAADHDRDKYDRIWGEYAMLGRMGHPIEVARPALFLLSDDASFITGADLSVDGGYTAMGPEGLGKSTIDWSQ